MYTGVGETGSQCGLPETVRECPSELCNSDASLHRRIRMPQCRCVLIHPDAGLLECEFQDLYPSVRCKERAWWGGVAGGVCTPTSLLPGLLAVLGTHLPPSIHTRGVACAHGSASGFTVFWARRALPSNLTHGSSELNESKSQQKKNSRKSKGPSRRS